MVVPLTVRSPVTVRAPPTVPSLVTTSVPIVPVISPKDVEPETLASLIQRNQKLKAILYENAEQLNLVVKESRLPVDE